FPRYRYRLNSISSLMFAKLPSAWILRFIRSCVPYSLVIRSSVSRRFSFIFLETYSTFWRSSIGVLQLFPLIHSVLKGHSPQLLLLYTVTTLRYPLAVFSFFSYWTVSVRPFLQ